jgi:hypothetical protein
MEILVAFAVGYFIGARAGSEGFDDVVNSFDAVRESDEFKGLVAAVRSHVSHTLLEMSSIVGGDAKTPVKSVGDVVSRVRNLVGSRLDPEAKGATSRES